MMKIEKILFKKSKMFKSNMIWVNKYSKRFFCKPSYKEQINATLLLQVPLHKECAN